MNRTPLISAARPHRNSVRQRTDSSRGELVLLLVIDPVFPFEHDHEHEHEKEADDRLALLRGNVAYIFQSACEKRRPVTAMAAAAVRQKWFVGQQWRAKNCGKNKYGAAVHFPFRRPGALI